MSTELPHDWQNNLMNEIEDIERQLDALERIGTIQRVKDDYDNIGEHSKGQGRYLSFHRRL